MRELNLYILEKLKIDKDSLKLTLKRCKKSKKKNTSGRILL